MAKRLLHIIATPRGLASNTGRVSGVVLEELDARYDDLEVTTLDLFSADLPAAIGEAWAGASAGAVADEQTLFGESAPLIVVSTAAAHAAVPQARSALRRAPRFAP